MKILAAIFGVVAVILVACALLALGAFIGGAVIWLLWNYVIAALFDVPALSYWQSWGISLGLSVIGGYFRQSNSNSSSN